MARLQKRRRSKTLPSARKSIHLKNPVRLAASGPRRILRYLFGSRKKRYSWTLFQISTAEPFFITPTSPESMQIHLDLDGEGGISGNTRGSHSPHRGVDGLQVRNRRSVAVSGSTVGSLSFTPKTGVVGGSPGGGRRGGYDGSEELGGFAASGDGNKSDSDSDNDSGKDLWLLTYEYFRNQHPASARKKCVIVTNPASPSSSSSKATPSSSSNDSYVADFDLEADPWLLTYNFLDSLNNDEHDNDSALQQPATVNKEPKLKKTISSGRSIRRKRNNADMRALWVRDNDHDDDEVGISPIPHASADNEVQNPIHNPTPTPPTQHPRPSHPSAPPPSKPQMPNPLPTKYFPPAHTHLSHQGSGSRYPYPPPPPKLRISVPTLRIPLTDPEPAAPPPTMQNFEAAPLSDSQGERGVVVEWHNSRDDPLELEDQGPGTAPNGGFAHRMKSGRRRSAFSQGAAINFTNNPPPPVKNRVPTVLRAGQASRHFAIDPTPPPVVVDRFPTVLRSGPASPHFNAHLDFSFDTLASSSSLRSPRFNSPTQTKPTPKAATPQTSPPTTLPTFAFTFPFETSPSPTLEEKIDQEYEAALSRWTRDGEKREKRVRRSREVRECMRRLRECTAFEGGSGGWGWGF